MLPSRCANSGVPHHSRVNVSSSRPCRPPSHSSAPSLQGRSFSTDRIPFFDRTILDSIVVRDFAYEHCEPTFLPKMQEVFLKKGIECHRNGLIPSEQHASWLKNVVAQEAEACKKREKALIGVFNAPYESKNESDQDLLVWATWNTLEGEKPIELVLSQSTFPYERDPVLQRHASNLLAYLVNTRGITYHYPDVEKVAAIVSKAHTNALTIFKQAGFKPEAIDPKRYGAQYDATNFLVYTHPAKLMRNYVERAVSAVGC